MTRFWITLEQGARFVIRCIERMKGGEIFVPKIPSAGIMELVASAAPGCTVDFIGIRAGEKLHEVLISEDEARTTVEYDDHYVVKPPPPWHFGDSWGDGRPVPDGFRFCSDTNTSWLNGEELIGLLGGDPVLAR